MNELQYFNGTSFSKTEKEYLCYQLGDCELQTAKKRFDMITELLASGVPHIALSVLSYLDAKDLVVAEQVSTTWRDIIRYSYDWKQLVESNVERNPLWKSVFSRRGWYKYLSKSVHIGRELYRQLYQCVSRDIHSLDLNWKKGHYTLTRINTGSTVTCLRFDTKKIVSGHGAEDYTIKIWDRSTLELTKVLRGHTGTVNCLEFNEQIIVSCSDDTTVRVWDIETGLLVNKLLHHQKWVFALKFTDKTLVTGSGDKTVAVWNFESPTAITLRTVLADHESSVYTVDLSESIIASGAGDGKIKVWDSYTGELIHSLHGHKKAVRCLLLQGSHIISGSFDRTIRMWSIDTGKCLQVFSGHQKWTMCVGYDGKRILSGSRDETIKIWNTVGGLMQNRSQCLATLKEHTGWVRALQFDDFHLMSCSSTTIHIYDFLGSNNNNFCLQTQTNIERALSSS